MSWVAVGVGAVSLVAGYAENEANQDAQKENTEEQIKAQKELLAQKRQYELLDRKFKQDAVGGWSKYLDPKLIGGAGGGNTLAPAKSASGAPTVDANGMPITDPNDPMFQANPTAAPSNALPLLHAQFPGGKNIMSFAAANPDYDFFNPNPNYVKK